MSAGLVAEDLRHEPLVEVLSACPGVRVELRYATPRNFTRVALYPAGARCYLRQGVAAKLLHAQELLRPQGFGLKIWDGYRPAQAQRYLWHVRPDPELLGDPARGGSLHSWGVAVDLTLVDPQGAPVAMPTDFDEFGPAATSRYRGADPVVARNLLALQRAMMQAGFYLMRDEWWHFVARNHAAYGPCPAPPDIAGDGRRVPQP